MDSLASFLLVDLASTLTYCYLLPALLHGAQWLLDLVLVFVGPVGVVIAHLLHLGLHLLNRLLPVRVVLLVVELRLLLQRVLDLELLLLQQILVQVVVEYLLVHDGFYTLVYF